MTNNIKLIVKHFYRFTHRDYGVVHGQLTFYDRETGYMEVWTESGDFIPMNLALVEGIG